MLVQQPHIPSEQRFLTPLGQVDHHASICQVLAKSVPLYSQAKMFRRVTLDGVLLRQTTGASRLVPFLAVPLGSRGACDFEFFCWGSPQLGLPLPGPPYRRGHTYGLIGASAALFGGSIGSTLSWHRLKGMCIVSRGSASRTSGLQLSALPPERPEPAYSVCDGAHNQP